MPVVLVLDKSGSIKEVNIKNYDETELYKKAGFKTDTDFSRHTVWNVRTGGKEYSVSVYGKTDGRANQENKYDFPPPVDNTLFFGSCVLVNKDENNRAIDLTEVEWDKIYEKLFGGFEDIGDEDSIESEDSIPDSVPRTKDGYVKDGFIVDDPEDDDSEEEYVPKKKPKKVGKKAGRKVENVVVEEPKDFLDCTDELSEEAYF
jgi:hypothetical protein